jgi:DNA-directed RNA polymerase specialized sigma24 family protein
MAFDAAFKWPDERADSELIESIKNGNAEEAEDALAELITRYHDDVDAQVKRALYQGRCQKRNEHHPDVVQDVWVIVCSSIKTVRDNVRGWLYSVSWSTANHHMRRCIRDERALRQFSPDEKTEPTTPQLISYPDTRAGGLTFEQLFKEASDISPTFGVIFALYIGHDWSFEEISTYQGRSLAAVRAEYYRGRREMKKRRGASGSDGSGL